ncbi:unnamed protein product [Rhizophagus irregularis]|nr:unnamed protein product [Rhizophagus irregularis]
MLHITRYAFGSRVTSEVQEIQRFVRLSGSALRFSSQVTSEEWKSKEFVRLSGDFRKMEIQRIRKFGSQVTSEEWKSKEFVRLSGDFRRMEKTKFHKFETWFSLAFESRGVSGGIPKNRIPKDSFLSVLGVGYIGFGFRFLGFGYMGSAFGYWALDIWISAFGYWALDRFPLRTYIEQIGFPLSNFWLGKFQNISETKIFFIKESVY